MKKIVKISFTIIFAAVSAVIFCVCAFGAWNNEKSYFQWYEHDGCSTCVRFVVDEAAKKAKVTELIEYDYCSFIPKTVNVIDDDSDEERTGYTVTSVELDVPDDDYVQQLFIPETVTEIKNVGYWKDWEGYWMSDEEEEPKAVKINNFTVGCIKGSYAETYAKENGFKIRYYYNLDRSNVKLSAESFFCIFDDIEPKVTVTVNEKTLTEGKDYYVEYENNCNIGTARLIVTGCENYLGTVVKTFKITKVPASEVSVDVDETVFEYDGKAHKMWFSLFYNDYYLDEGKDYKVTYSNNVVPGTATAKITFFGDVFTGTKTLNYKIIIPPVENVETEANSDSTVRLSWTWYGYASGVQFNVYRYDAAQKKYVYIGKSTDSYRGFTDKKTAQLTKYTYRVVPMLKLNGKNYYAAAVAVSVTTTLKSPAIKGSVLNKSSIKLNWAKNAKADGYIIYRRRIKKTGLSAAKKIGTIQKNSVCSFTDKTISPKYDYYYSVRAFKKIGNKTYYSVAGSFCRSDTPSTILAGAQLKKRDSIKVYNTQGAKTTYYTYTISKRDQQVLKKFADKHFKKNMSREEKLRYTLNWINKNVIYATGNNWNKICGKGYADAVFTYKLGQCVQYNGAMAEMMAYLGYDAYIIQGYRGSRSTGRIWQHFWCEVNINGRVYLMETGNYDCDGNWHYFLTPYSQTSGYIKNNKYLGV